MNMTTQSVTVSLFTRQVLFWDVSRFGIRADFLVVFTGAPTGLLHFPQTTPLLVSRQRSLWLRMRGPER